MSRQRDLIQGPLLLVGGIVVLVLYFLALADATDPTPDPQRPPGGGRFPIYIVVAAGAAAITGLLQKIRGLTGRSR